VSDSSNLYTIERTSSGFVVKFQTTSSSAANLVGGDIVKLEYLSSNGSNANGTSVFTSIVIPNSGVTIVNNLPSSNFSLTNLIQANDGKLFGVTEPTVISPSLVSKL
jgi:hypothetical protein